MSSSSSLVILTAVVFVCRHGSIATTTVTSRGLEYSVLEQLPVGSFVADLLRDANLTERYSSRDQQRLRFQIRATGANLERSRFTVDERAGVVRTGEVLDREQLCPDAKFQPESACELALEVTVRPREFFQIIKVNVRVIDVNDNTPTFSQSEVTVRISETAAPGSLFMLPSADDADSGPYGVREYQLMSSDDGLSAASDLPFDLKVTDDESNGLKDVKLRLTNRLDREQQSTYHVIVVASDGGNPVRSSQLTVNVQVLDTNDNDPQFNQSTYTVDVREDTLPGTPLIQTLATDLDEGANAAVVYSLPEHVERTYGHLFRIDEQTGVVFLRSPVDYERATVYHLAIAANDLGSPPSLPVFAKLTINVLDVNDNRPSIAINILTESGMAEVRENVDQAGTFVAHVAVRDADSGDNGKVDCQLDEIPTTSDGPLFRLEPLFDASAALAAAGASVEYKITTTSTFDRERKAMYRLQVTCRDHGIVSSLETTREIQVNILDDNDNSPLLDRESYLMTIHENNRVGSEVLRVNASDADSGNNAKLVYKLKALDMTSPDVLSVDPSSGRVTTLISFDYETEPRHFTYLLTVSDSGDIPRSVSATISLDIADVNDNKPRFDRPAYYMTTAENQPIGSSVGRVNASDDDISVEFNRVVYDIVRASRTTVAAAALADGSKPITSSDSSAFDVDRYTGIVRNVKRLDREQCAIYLLTVSVSNDVTTAASSSRATQGETVDFAEVTVYVDDVNDNTPVFVFPGPRRGRSADVSSRSPVGGLVTRLEATDIDSGPNSQLEYSIYSGDDERLFQIDPWTGVITVSRDRLPSGGQQLKLIVHVRDHGSPPLQAVADLVVTINDTAAAAAALTARISSSVADAGTAGDSDAVAGTVGGMNVAIVAAIGVAAGVFLVIVCVVIVAVTVCLVKRRVRRQQVNQIKQQPSCADGVDTASSLGGHSSCCQHRCRSTSIIKPGYSSGYIREPGPGDDGSITTYRYHQHHTSQEGEAHPVSLRSSMSSLSAGPTQRDNRGQGRGRLECNCRQLDQVDDDDETERASSTDDNRIEHQLVADGSFAIESPDGDNSVYPSDSSHRHHNLAAPPMCTEQRPVSPSRRSQHHHCQHRRHSHRRHSHHRHSRHTSPPGSCHHVHCNHSRSHLKVPSRTQLEAASAVMKWNTTAEPCDVTVDPAAVGLLSDVSKRQRLCYDTDSQSQCSCSCSCADSGRGPSEDDDLLHLRNCLQCSQLSATDAANNVPPKSRDEPGNSSPPPPVVGSGNGKLSAPTVV